MSAELSLPAAGVPPAASPKRPGAARIVCRRVLSEGDRADHFAIRRRIFVGEQAIFAESDLDRHDRDPSAIALNGYCDGVAAGTVRLFLLDPDDRRWQGERLAVLAQYRMRGVGAPLLGHLPATGRPILFDPEVAAKGREAPRVAERRLVVYLHDPVSQIDVRG